MSRVISTTVSMKKALSDQLFSKRIIKILLAYFLSAGFFCGSAGC